MKKEIRDILSYYIGQEAMADGNRFIIGGIHISDEGCTAYDGTFIGGIPQGWWIENCGFKLLLRPLSDITKQEEDDLIDMGYSFSYPSYTIQDEIGKREAITFFEAARITQYLTSKGFDIFGLIESGIAVDKTKI